MKFEQYIKESKRTMNDKGFELNVYHACLGIITESAEIVDTVKKHVYYDKELDLNNINEEIGDLLWYIAILYREFPDLEMFETSFVFDGLEKTTKERTTRQLIIVCLNFNKYTANFVNLLQFLELQLSESDILIKKLYSCLSILIREIYLLIKLSNINLETDLETILDINIAKLKVRYPDKFTNELALNRYLDKEKEVLYNHEINKDFTV